MPRLRYALLSAVVLGGVAVLAITHPEQTRAFSNNLKSLAPFPVALAFLLILAQVSAQALRLWAIIPRDTPLRVIQAGYTFAVGDCTNIFVPVRGGDALKILLMSRTAHNRGLTLPRATGALLADKVVDIGTFVLLSAMAGLIGVLVTATPVTLPGPRMLIGASVALGLVLVLVRVGWPRLSGPVRNKLRTVGEGLSGLRDPGRCAASVSFSLAARVLEVLALRALCAAIGIPVSIPRIFLAHVIVNVGISVPVSVANLGVYEAALAYGFTRAGVALPVAVTIATTHHVLELLGISLSAAGYTVANQLWPAG